MLLVPKCLLNIARKTSQNTLVQFIDVWRQNGKLREIYFGENNPFMYRLVWLEFLWHDELKKNLNFMFMIYVSCITISMIHYKPM